MKKTYSILCFFLVILAPVVLSSQNRKTIDSLENVLRREQPDTQRVNVFNALANNYRFLDPDKHIEYARKALSLARSTGFTRGLANAYNMVGLAYENEGRYRAAEQYYDSSVTAWKAAGSVSGEARLTLNMANVHVKQADYPGAIEYTLKSMKLQESAHDTLGVAACKFTLGNIYYYQNNPRGALRQYLDAWQMNRRSDNNVEFESAVLSNIGGMFKALGMHDSSLYYYRIALGNMQRNGIQSRYGSNYNNIGSVWFSKGNLDSALFYHRIALGWHRKMEYPEGIVNALATIGNDHYEMHRYDSALYYHTRAMELAGKIGLRQKKLDSYYEMMNTYEAMKQYDKALEYAQLYIDLNDSIHGDSQSASIERLKKSYELDQKDQALRLSEAQRIASDERNSRNTTLFIGAGIIGLLVIIIVLYMFLSKQKHNRVLAKMNREISSQKKEITDSIDYAKKIQEAILPVREDIRRGFSDSFVIWMPRNVVSGDFYWFTERNGRQIIASVDCTGHGVPGAFMSMIGNTLLNEIVLEKEITTPNEVLDMLHSRIRTVLRQESQTQEAGSGQVMQDGMDIAFCLFDKEKGILSYSGANRPVYLVRNGTITEAIPDKQPIGGSFSGLHKPFSLKVFDLQPGDCVYLFSDGYPDQFGGEKGKKFMSRRFQELILSVHTRNMEEQKRALTERFLEWKNGHEQVDDVLVIGVKF